MNNLINKHYKASINDGSIKEEMEPLMFLDKMQDRLLDCYEEVHSVLGMNKDKYAQKLIELSATALNQVKQLGIDPELKYKSVILLREQGSDEAILFSNLQWKHYSSGLFKNKGTHLRIDYTEIFDEKIFRHIETKNSIRKTEYFIGFTGNSKTEEEIINHIKDLKK